MKFVVAILFLACCSCAIPFVRLADDVSVRQVSWSSGRIWETVETSVRNTGDKPVSLLMKCESETDGMEPVRHMLLKPGETVTFRDRVQRPVNGSGKAKDR